MAALIDYNYYISAFGGEAEEREFLRLASLASDMCEAAVGRSLAGPGGFVCDEVKKAVAYQTELLAKRGGADAVLGGGGGDIESERLGDYSVGRAAPRGSPSLGGMPFSPLAEYWLRRAGYLNRCVASEEAGEKT